MFEQMLRPAGEAILMSELEPQLRRVVTADGDDSRSVSSRHVAGLQETNDTQDPMPARMKHCGHCCTSEETLSTG